MQLRKFFLLAVLLGFVCPILSYGQILPPERVHEYLSAMQTTMASKLTIKETKLLKAGNADVEKKLYIDPLKNMGFDYSATVKDYCEKLVDEDFTMQTGSMMGMFLSIVKDRPEIMQRLHEAKYLSADAYAAWGKFKSNKKPINPDYNAQFHVQNPDWRNESMGEDISGLSMSRSAKANVLAKLPPANSSIKKPSIELKGLSSIDKSEQEIFTDFIGRFFSDGEFQTSRVRPNVNWRPMLVAPDEKRTLLVNIDTPGGNRSWSVEDHNTSGQFRVVFEEVNGQLFAVAQDYRRQRAKFGVDVEDTQFSLTPQDPPQWRLILYPNRYPNLSAYRAGLRDKDILYTLDGVEISAVRPLELFVSKKEVGDTIQVVVYRDGQRLEIPVLMVSYPE